MPRIYPQFSGSAFNGNYLQSFRIWSRDPNKEKLIFIPLTDFCKVNFISRNTGRTLIKKKLVIAKRCGGVWWVAQKDSCIEELKDFLDVNEINWNNVTML
jgi:hypothetical protein